MKFQVFYLFYFLAAFLIVCSFAIGLPVLFISLTAMSLLTGLIYQLVYSSGRYISQAFIIAHIMLVVIGLILTLNILRSFAVLVDTGAPDTAALSEEFQIVAGPLCLLTSLVMFIIGLSTSKKRSAA